MNRLSCTSMLTVLLLLVSVRSAVAAETAVSGATNTSPSGTSVLEQFRTYSGERTAAGLLRLFSSRSSSGIIRQEPEIALSDGKTVVELTVAVSGTSNSAPNFACIDALLISAKPAAPGFWLVKILPDAGSWKTLLIIQNGSSSTSVYPVVAPPLSSESDLSMKSYLRHVSERGKLADLNNDGLLDYQDEYIYAANVLAAKNANPHDPDTRNKRARELTPARKRL